MKHVHQENCVLVVQEDSQLLRNVAAQLQLHGYRILLAANSEEATAAAIRYKPLHCVLGLTTRGENRLQLLAALRSIVPQIQVVVATEYGSVATAVAAMKCGAKDYLAKPFKVDDLVSALRGESVASAAKRSAPCTAEAHLALRRVEWEYIQRVLMDCDGNISETAKRLHVHRRTLQRKLSKHPVPEIAYSLH